MQNRKKVSGERLGAAILDSIFLSIVTLIPTAIYMAITVDWENALDSLLVTFTYGEQGYATFLIFTLITELVLGIIYFGYIPFKMNGQTFGKKILKIKAVDEYGENPTFFKHCVRGIQNWTGYISIPFLLLLLIMDDQAFIILFGVFGNIMNLVMFVSLILVFSKEDGRGIHDMVAGTSVVSVNEDFNKEFAMKTAQMGDWADVSDSDDSGFGNTDSEKDKDDWSF